MLTSNVLTVRRASKFILSLVHSILFRLIHDINANIAVEYVDRNDGQYLFPGHLRVRAGVDNAMGKDSARTRKSVVSKAIETTFKSIHNYYIFQIWTGKTRPYGH